MKIRKRAANHRDRGATELLAGNVEDEKGIVESTQGLESGEIPKSRCSRDSKAPSRPR